MNPRNIRFKPRAQANKGFGVAANIKKSESHPKLPKDGHLYYRTSNILPTVNHVQVFQEEGKGRGLRATQRIAPGTLLLACCPALVITDVPGAQPQPAQLSTQASEYLDSKHLSKLQAVSTNSYSAFYASDTLLSLFKSLYDGCATSIQGLPSLSDLAEGRASSTPHLRDKPCLDGDLKTNPGLALAETSYKEILSSETVSRVIDLNCYGEPWGDVSAWACRGQGQSLCSFLGVWPAMALINHSCTPNTSTIVLRNSNSVSSSAEVGLITQLFDAGAISSPDHLIDRRQQSPTRTSGLDPDLLIAGAQQGYGSNNGIESEPSSSDVPDGSELMMLVRAAKEIKAGEEITIAYTGRHITSPVSQRQALLHASYGFTCTCPRCRSELDLMTTDVGQSVLEACMDLEGGLRDVVMTAVEDNDVDTLKECQEDLLSISSRIQDILVEAPDPEKSFLQSWIYSCYELLGLISEALIENLSASCSGGDTRALRVKGQTRSPRSSGPRRKGLGGAKRRAVVASKAGIMKKSDLEEMLKCATAASLHSVEKRIEILGEVSPASYQHAALSARLLQKMSEDQGCNPAAMQAALETCTEVHVARYGRVDIETLSRLVSYHEGNDLVELLAKQQQE
ncbi:hypothetical protein CEUSTIGMA_g447.t1 [Chlamydomonas eustigma]|uniref:SET domain-containing protein n=1 Tax=Chlamydomonas eustigma TaxID=1157962 RepID=A0A250WQ71_9CHLO|nr:hypothetical protein CEUSTIGMA_g447.t1 [Chlamydomonas eustigma]|eukprot:GAX72995.1 hypothetical protein CEUSTIGMA_g447.t1 [Chlamydomonas eustigma]